MDSVSVLKEFSTLGPALGSVVAIGIVCYLLVKLIMKVLDMFDRHGAVLSSMEKNLDAHTNVINDLSRNVQANTRSTERVVEILDRKAVIHS